MMHAKQEWESIFGDDAFDVLESHISDLSFALAEAMNLLNIKHGRIGEYEVFLASDGSAVAIHKDENNNQIPSRAIELRIR